MNRKTWLVRLTAFAAVAVLVVGAVGCGGGDDDAGGSEFSVGLVTDTAGPNDRGFNEFSIAGLEKAGEDLGVDTRVYVSAVEDDYLPNLTAAAEDGHDLVIGVGFLLLAQTNQVAQEFPDTMFAGVDHFYGGDGCEDAGTCEQPNLLGMQYPSEESGYLAGIVAALTTQSKTVSTVGGIKIPPVDNWIAGFQAGVAATDPSVKTLNAYSQDFVDQAKCKEIALDQISQGSDIVFQVAGDCGLGAIDGACEAGKWAIGVDADQSAQGDCVITSGLKPLESSVFSVIESVVDGTFEGGTNVFFGIQDLPDADLLAPLSDDVGEGAQEAVDEALEGLRSGEIDPPSTVE
ncbi:MAG: BMP family ABC transporter substrate-binding protein [Actinomycetota bacterium]|nr:BMP family ABC transporter substrate-binding protein [Actinomycetota bacterium]